MKGFFRASKARLAGLMQPRTNAAYTSAQRLARVSHHQASETCREGVWVLEFDIPAWGFHKGEQVRVFPNAPIYLDDIVALRSEHGLKLARYRDEYMGSVAGLAVRM